MDNKQDQKFRGAWSPNISDPRLAPNFAAPIPVPKPSNSSENVIFEVNIDESDGVEAAPSVELTNQPEQEPEPEPEPEFKKPPSESITPGYVGENKPVKTSNKPVARKGNVTINSNYNNLIRAVYDGKIADIAQILKTTPEIVNSAENLNFYTPLLLAAETNDKEISMTMCKMLIEKGASLKVFSKHGYTPFTQACNHGNIELVKYFMSLGEDVHQKSAGVPPIVIASERNHLELVKFLLANGADVNAPCIGQKANGQTAIHNAALEGHIEVVKYLLTMGAPHNSFNNPARITPFYCAIERGRYDVASYFLSIGGVNVNHIIANGAFPLYMACQKGFIEIVKLLLENGADINMRFKGKFTGEHIAKTKKHFNVVKLLHAYQSGKPLVIEKDEGCVVM